MLALLDTGSDMTSIPPSIVERFEMPQVNEARIRVYDVNTGARRVEKRPVVQAHIDLGGSLPAINVPCVMYAFEVSDDDAVSDDEEPEHIIIGRDILNLLILALHGPNRRLRLQLP